MRGEEMVIHCEWDWERGRDVERWQGGRESHDKHGHCPMIISGSKSCVKIFLLRFENHSQNVALPTQTMHYGAIFQPAISPNLTGICLHYSIRRKQLWRLRNFGEGLGIEGNPRWKSLRQTFCIQCPCRLVLSKEASGHHLNFPGWPCVSPSPPSSVCIPGRAS